MSVWPVVSICTPTFNRRPFINLLIEMIKLQSYPMEKLEWVILDDGTDPIEDLVKNLDFIKVNYNRINTSGAIMNLGEKRNILNTKANGEYLIYFDDDDYYPPDRIKHGIEKLINNKNYLIAGSSRMNIYYQKINKIYQSGPYGPFHATAATFIFHKQLLKETSFNSNSLVGEEKDFLKNYTIPLIQLDVKKTILVLAHPHNTFDKYKLLENIEQHKMSLTTYRLGDLVESQYFIGKYQHSLYLELEIYNYGKPNMKPKVMEFINNRIKEKEELKEKIEKYEKSTNRNPQLQEYEEKLEKKTKIIKKLLNEIKGLKEELVKTKQSLEMKENTR